MADAQQDDTVTLEGLESALNDLVKAAEATDLIKGGIEHSGRVDEKGKGGGGRADYADAGGLDNMMVGKMAEAGIPADLISEFSEFLGKQKDEDEDEDEDEEDMEGYKGKKYGKSDSASDDDDSDDETFTKSMDAFREDSDIASALDVSPYLEAMTMRTAEQIDDMRKSLSERFGNQNEVNRRQAAALYQIGTLVKSQSEVIAALGSRLGLVERTPNAPKGKTSAAALHKSMPGEAGAGGKQLAKSELLSVLSYMNLEKGMKHIGQQSTVEAIGLLEGGGTVSDDVIAAAHDFIASNPAAEKEARSYS